MSPKTAHFLVQHLWFRRIFAQYLLRATDQDRDVQGQAWWKDTVPLFEPTFHSMS